ncbi:MAG TPA: SPOR domain-containing protein [Burkholderiales bacterium]|jgi:cell division protein FtsN
MVPHRGHRRGTAARRLPGWVVLLLGLALGAASVLLVQLVNNRAGSTDGIAGLFTLRARPAEPAPAKQRGSAPLKPKLDFYTVLPEIETILPERGTRAKTAKAERADADARYILQVGSFGSFADADQLKAKLALQGMAATIQKVTIEGKGEYHRVRLGPYEKLDDLDNAGERLSKLGIKSLRLKVKSGG